MTRLIPPALLALALAACNQPADDAPAPAPASGDSSPPLQAPGGGAEAGTGQSAPIMLDVILPQDLSAEPLPGELGCAFTFSRGDDPLLVARGNVGDTGPAAGAVKIDGTVMRLSNQAAGGFDPLPDGASFSNGTVSAAIEVTGEADAGLGSGPGAAPVESPLKTARLTIARGTRQIAVDGFYACGP